jgi:DNA-binding MarR family transcriptional regulator
MAKQLDLSVMPNCICFNLRWVTRVVTQFFDAELRRHAIRTTQTPVLGVLSASGAMGMSELSDWLAMERTTLVRNLRPLQRDGLVRVTGNGRGSRAEVAITERGRKMVATMLPAWRAPQDQAIRTLGKERWSAIINDLESAALKLSPK